MPVSQRGVQIGEAAARSGDAAPAGRAPPFERITPSVRVPVLSVHSTSMLPRFSIASRRRTMTPLARHARGRRADRVTADDRRQQLGRQPDRERDREQQRLDHGRSSSRLMANTTAPAPASRCISRYAELPHAALEFGLRRGRTQPMRRWRRTRCARRCPPPARVAVPLRTEVPMNTRWCAAAIGVSAPARPAASPPGRSRRSGGLDDEEVPRLQHQAVGRDQVARPPAAPRRPAPAPRPEPSAAGHRAAGLDRQRQRAQLLPPRARRGTPARSPDRAAGTMARMIEASSHSPSASETMAPNSRISTSGLLN